MSVSTDSKISVKKCANINVVYFIKPKPAATDSHAGLLARGNADMVSSQ
jgi:hypothetical protein